LAGVGGWDVLTPGCRRNIRLIMLHSVHMHYTCAFSGAA
jgi:hypothetical protein